MDKLQIPREEVEALVKELAGLLGETTTGPIKQIKRIIQYCGTDFARNLYKETEEIEAQGGMMVAKLERRRTKGGVFFHLTRQKISDELHSVIFPQYKNNKRGNNKRPPLGIPLFKWKKRIAIIESLKADQGEIKSMKVTLSGRPGSIEKRPEVIITTMSYTVTVQNLPREIPRPPETPTLYTVYMSPKQWESIEESMADPADTLLIDGVCAFDPQTSSMAVFATTARSELSEAKAKAKTAAAAAAAKPPKPAKEAKPAKSTSDKAAVKAKSPAQSQPQGQSKDAKKSRFVDTQPETIAVNDVPLNPNLPPDAARKLNELNASATLFRQKVDNLLAKPPGQQFGLEMTQKLLKNVEDEIAALKKKHNA
jgi:hypothetical protein